MTTHECSNCGDPISGTSWSYCSSKCKREGSEKARKGMEDIRKFFVEKGREILSAPRNYDELRESLAQEFGTTRTAAGMVLMELNEAGYFNMYPNRYTNIKICHLRHCAEAASTLWKKISDQKFRELPAHVKSRVVINRQRIDELKPAILKLWRSGQFPEAISRQLNINEKSVKRVISESGG